MTKILFVCSANRSRSRTAERIYANHPGLEVKSAGVDCLEAPTPVSKELLQWADVILCMEKRHQKEIENDYAYCIEGKVIDSIGVGRFIYSGMTEMIKEKVDTWLSAYQKSKETDKSIYSTSAISGLSIPSVRSGLPMK
jgi:predicted protein tyrosine phosphatase